MPCHFPAQRAAAGPAPGARPKRAMASIHAAAGGRPARRGLKYAKKPPPYHVKIDDDNAAYAAECKAATAARQAHFTKHGKETTVELLVRARERERGS